MFGEERSGPFEKEHSDDDLLEFVTTQEVVTTKEVAEHFDYHIQTARRRLKALHDAGRIQQKDVGKRYVWWVSEKVKQGSGTSIRD